MLMGSRLQHLRVMGVGLALFAIGFAANLPDAKHLPSVLVLYLAAQVVFHMSRITSRIPARLENLLFWARSSKVAAEGGQTSGPATD